MIVEIDGQVCSTQVTHKDNRSWCGVVERREKTAAGNVVFRANVEVYSIDELIRRDEILRQRDQAAAAAAAAVATN